jgi:hypothetical protein
MIIPRGTEIRVNQSGQLSIKTPGNLVIQNSGKYSEIESTNGSIRIEENVTVEAVSVRAGQACFIQGMLTAWKVHAKKIALEDKARAYIMVQESEQLELARTARLVGNFANENELLGLMSKFSPQLKSLPAGGDAVPSVEPTQQRVAIAQTQPHGDDEHLRMAQALLERELGRTDLQPSEAEALREVLYALRERNVARVGIVYKQAFAEMKTSSDGIRQAQEQLEKYFQR